MRLYDTWLVLLFGAVLLSSIEARRVRVRPVQQEEEEDDNVQYYAADPEERPQHRVVLVSSADQYNGLYGQPTASPRTSHDNYIPQSRASLAQSKASAVQPRQKESNKAPPVQTIRNYSKVNDDGSFTFGYEADDGSFKEETRGTDCVVRGKYGYVDPDGNKREFTYVSGNPCDPNAPKEEHEESQEEERNEENASPNYPTRTVANYPTRPIRPIRPVTVAPKPVTYFQNNYDEQSEEEQPEPEQVLKQQPVRRPSYITRPDYLQQQPAVESQTYQRPQYVPSTTPASLIYKQSIAPITITPRPTAPTSTPKAQLPATTYRPQLLQYSVTPRPSFLYTKQLQSTTSPAFLYTPRSGLQSSSRPTVSPLDFASEIQRFQHDNTISPTPSPVIRTTPKLVKSTTSSSSLPVYQSAIVFDPSSGQYKTQLYQSLPQTEGDFTVNQRLQPYVHQPTRQVINIQQLQQQSPLYGSLSSSSLRSSPLRSSQLSSSQLGSSQLSSSQLRQIPQQAYQQQQAELQFQNSAQLYAQQQKVRSQQQQQQKSASQIANQPQPQALYYIQPSSDQSPALASGQIDAFLRGHNIQF